MQGKAAPANNGIEKYFSVNIKVYSGFKSAKPNFQTIYHFVLFSVRKKLKPSMILLRYFADNQL